MSIRMHLKQEFAEQLVKDGAVALNGGDRAIEIYRPESPNDDVEVRMNTLEGQAMMAHYHQVKDKFAVAVCEASDNGSMTWGGRRALTKPVYFDSPELAADALITKGLEVKGLWLSRLVSHKRPDKSSVTFGNLTQ